MWLTRSAPASLLECETPLAHCTGYASLDLTGAEDNEAAHRAKPAHKETTTFLADTPFLCASNPVWTYSRPFPTTSGAGAAT